FERDFRGVAKIGGQRVARPKSREDVIGVHAHQARAFSRLPHLNGHVSSPSTATHTPAMISVAETQSSYRLSACALGSSFLTAHEISLGAFNRFFEGEICFCDFHEGLASFVDLLLLREGAVNKSTGGFVIFAIAVNDDRVSL
ncbi:MAG: hypothetical protein WAW42_16965, partial [Candidatus Competibacteraceae bacterium]